MNPIPEIRALCLAVLAATLSLGGALAAAVPLRILLHSNSPEVETSPDISSPELIAKGHEFFLTSCSECHGDDAHGDEGPDLHRLALSNGRVVTTIKKGVKGEMPSFAKKYDDAQIAALVAYVRSLKD